MGNCQTQGVTPRHRNQGQLPSICELDIGMHTRGTHAVRTKGRHGEGHPCALQRTHSSTVFHEGSLKDTVAAFIWAASRALFKACLVYIGSSKAVRAM